MSHHPFRQGDHVIHCVSCAEEAVIQCEGCGRPFCDHHIMVNNRCADCEIATGQAESSSIARRHALGAVGGVGVGIASALTVTQSPFFVLAVAGISYTVLRFGGALVGRVFRHRKARKRELLLAPPSIARDGGEQREEVRRGLPHRPAASRMRGRIAKEIIHTTWGSR